MKILNCPYVYIILKIYFISGIAIATMKRLAAKNALSASFVKQVSFLLVLNKAEKVTMVVKWF